MNADDDALADFLDAMASAPFWSNATRDKFQRAAALFREVGGGKTWVSGEYFVGVVGGKPVVQSCGDSAGDSKQVELFVKPEDASARFHNVRRCRLIVADEAVRAPESWGAIDG